MQTLTANLIRQPDAIEWFRSVGRRDIPEVVFVENWLAAVATCTDEKWSSLQLEASNLLGTRVLAKCQSRYNEWNQIVDGLKPQVIELTRRKVAPFMEAHLLPKEFWWNVVADVIGAAIECEYSDLIQPGFFTTPILDCYLKGHFPCGWEGNFPEGRLVLY